MVDNKEGLRKLLENIKDYLNNEIDLVTCISKHQELCYNNLDSHLDYFSDGWSKDTTMNLFKILVQAITGDIKAYTRLIVDLGVEDVNLNIVEVM